MRSGNQQGQLEEQIRWLVDRAQIEDLMASYARAVDTKDWPRWEALFTDDVEIGFPSGRHVGKRGLVDWVRPQAVAAIYPQHLITSHLIEIAGNPAQSHSYLYTTRFMDGVFTRERASYRNEYVRAGSGWLIRRMEVSLLPTAQHDQGLGSQ